MHILCFLKLESLDLIVSVSDLHLGGAICSGKVWHNFKFFYYKGNFILGMCVFWLSDILNYHILYVISYFKD